MLKAPEGRAAALETADRLITKLKDMKLAKATVLVETGIEETVACYSFEAEKQSVT